MPLRGSCLLMMQATEHSIHVGVGLRPGFIRPQARFKGRRLGNGPATVLCMRLVHQAGVPKAEVALTGVGTLLGHVPLMLM